MLEDLNLKPGERGELEDALVDAFRDRHGLGRLAERLGLRLGEFAAGNQREVVSQLLDEVGSRGWGKELLQDARKARPDNPKLREVAERLLGPAAEPVGSSPPPQRAPEGGRQVEASTEGRASVARGALKLRILHLSDLHERGPRAADRWRSNRVLGDAFRRNLNELVSEGGIDLVFFTGDVAHAGKVDEYARAADFVMKELLEPLKLPVERFYPVPGNHDIDRDLAERAWDVLRANYARMDAVELGRWMVGKGKPPPGFTEEQREKLLSRQEAYQGWVGERLGRKELRPGARSRLGYRHTLRLGEAAAPVEVHIIGLDSAWAAGDDGDAGKLGWPRLRQRQPGLPAGPRSGTQPAGGGAPSAERTVDGRGTRPCGRRRGTRRRLPAWTSRIPVAPPRRPWR